MDTLKTLENNFRTAYQKLHKVPLREFRLLDNGEIIINGIQFTAREAEITLEILENELAAKRVTLVKRLINFFGGKTP